MNLRSSAELSKLLSTCLGPRSPLVRPASLHTLCLRTAAIYATTALYEFHDKQSSIHLHPHGNHGDGQDGGHNGQIGGQFYYFYHNVSICSFDSFENHLM